MKSRQFCSVCKQWLDMEVVPTGDGDDDGVVWFRCPQCQGFLPKLGTSVADDGPGTAAGLSAGETLPASVPAVDADDEALDIDLVVAAAMGDEDAADDGLAVADVLAVADESESDEEADAPPLPAGALPAEPVLEYAAMLAAVDPATAIPYRPWAQYEIGQCILHLAWNDCGVVVGKEALPGGRSVIKCWFQGAGVVRLIENAPR